MAVAHFCLVRCSGAVVKRRIRLFACSVLAFAVPFLICTLYVSLTRGTAFKIVFLNFAFVILIVFGGVPFAVLMPMDRFSRGVFASASVAVNLVVGLIWGIWLSCAKYHSCF